MELPSHAAPGGPPKAASRLPSFPPSLLCYLLQPRWYYRAGLVFWPASKRLATTVRADPARQALRLHGMLVRGSDMRGPEATGAGQPALQQGGAQCYVHHCSAQVDAQLHVLNCAHGSRGWVLHARSRHACCLIATEPVCLPLVSPLQPTGAGVPAPLTEQAAAAAAKLKKRFPEGQPEGQAAGQEGGGGAAGGDAAAGQEGGAGSSGGELGYIDSDEEHLYDEDFACPSDLAVRQQRQEDWEARGQWGPEPEATPAELAAELLRYLASPGGWVLLGVVKPVARDVRGCKEAREACIDGFDGCTQPAACLPQPRMRTPCNQLQSTYVQERLSRTVPGLQAFRPTSRTTAASLTSCWPPPASWATPAWPALWSTESKVLLACLIGTLVVNVSAELGQRLHHWWVCVGTCGAALPTPTTLHPSTRSHSGHTAGSVGCTGVGLLWLAAQLAAPLGGSAEDL